MKEEKETLANNIYGYEDVLKAMNDKPSSDFGLYGLLILFLMLNNTNKEDTLKGIEKQLDEIKWLLTDKK